MKKIANIFLTCFTCLALFSCESEDIITDQNEKSMDDFFLKKNNKDTNSVQFTEDTYELNETLTSLLGLEQATIAAGTYEISYSEDNYGFVSLNIDSYSGETNRINIVGNIRIPITTSRKKKCEKGIGFRCGNSVSNNPYHLPMEGMMYDVNMIFNEENQTIDIQFDEYVDWESLASEELSSRQGTESESLQENFELMSKAASIKNITYSDNTYTISFYDEIPTYIVEITNFDEESLIEYAISSEQLETSTVAINIVEEIINIQNLNSFSFAEYDEFEVKPDNNILINIVSVITAHHILNPSESLDFEDNGNNDVFPKTNNDNGRIRFWHTTSNKIGPCDRGIQAYTVSYERFWLFKGTDYIELPC